MLGNQAQVFHSPFSRSVYQGDVWVQCIGVPQLWTLGAGGCIWSWAVNHSKVSPGMSQNQRPLNLGVQLLPMMYFIVICL